MGLGSVVYLNAVSRTNLLLVGNGPNYFSAGTSWEDVVRATARKARLANQTEKIIKEPLPLVYETIAARYPDKEKQARAELAVQMLKMVPNAIHHELMGLDWPTVLTTNYDECLESASGDKFVASNLEREATYSVFRRRSAGPRAVWHIHGDVRSPRTMMLGMHHYCGYLQKLRAYLTTPSQQSPLVLVDQSRSLESVRHSWADLFLRDDVHIIGLSLSYSEIVLWWLLAYKYRLTHQKKLTCGSTTFYYIGTGSASEKNRLEMLLAYGVIVKIVHSSTRPPTETTWMNVLRILRSVRMRDGVYGSG